MKLSIIIPTHNNQDTILKTIKSIYSSNNINKHEVEILLCDDFSLDGTRDVVKKNFPTVKILKLKKRSGAAKVRNLGIKNSKGDYLLFVDGDIWFNKSTIDKLIDEIKEVDIVFPKINYENYQLMYPVFDIEKKYPHISGCFLIKRTSLENLDEYFDEFYETYLEDYDFFMRCKVAGLKAQYVKAAVIHANKDKLVDYGERYYLELRNILYGKKKLGKLAEESGLGNPFRVKIFVKSVVLGILNFAWFNWYGYDRRMTNRKKFEQILKGKNKIFLKDISNSITLAIKAIRYNFDKRKEIIKKGKKIKDILCDNYINLTPEKIRIRNIIDKNPEAKYGPEYVTLDITNKCNLNCIGCWTYSPLLKNKPPQNWFKQEVSYKTIKKLIRDLKRMKTKKIRLTGGGEPFIHPNIKEIIQIIKKKGFELAITTNFTLINKKTIDFLIDNGVDNITVSLWSSNPKTYVKTHPNQTEKTFEKIKKNLEYLSKNKKNTRIVIANVISNLNHEEIEEMVEFSQKVADEVYFTLIDTIDGGTDSLLLNNKQRKKLTENFEKIIRHYKKEKYGDLKIDNPNNFLRRLTNEDSGVGRYDSNLVLSIPCTIGYTFSRIMANGDVAPCCRAVMIPSGNIKKQSFREIWNSEKQKRFREIGLDLKNHPRFIEKVGCLKSCDNIMENKETFDKLRSRDRK